MPTNTESGRRKEEQCTSGFAMGNENRSLYILPKLWDLAEARVSFEW